MSHKYYMGTWMAAAASLMAGIGFGVYKTWKFADRALTEQGKKLKRAEAYYEVLNEWVRLKCSGILLEKFFRENRYRRIAIYGFADLGQRLYEELQNMEMVEVAYIIDKNPDIVCAEKDVYAPSGNLPRADAIIVTPVFAFHEIKEMLEEMIEYPVISLEDVIYDV